MILESSGWMQVLLVDVWVSVNWRASEASETLLVVVQ